MTDLRKISILFLQLFFGCLVVVSSPTDKDFKKLIEKYDVSDSAKVVPKNNPLKFWQATLYHNEACIKFLRDIKKNRGAEKEAMKKISELPRFYPQFDESVIVNMQGFCDTMLINMGISLLPMKCSLHIIYSNEVNAFTALTENGFAICLTSSLLQRKNMKYEILMGYVAHEFVHGALQHHLRGLYAGAKQRRKNELAANIAAGLNAFAEGFNAGINGQTSYDTMLHNYLMENILEEEVRTSTLKYIFDYTVEQEYEADLIAYRFLENLLGSGEDYIDGLRIIGSVYNHLSHDNTDMLPTSSRINFLKYVSQNPDLGNKVNAKLRRGRVKKIYPPVQF